MIQHIKMTELRKLGLAWNVRIALSIVGVIVVQAFGADMNMVDAVSILLLLFISLTVT
jgi:hypothetical protein